ncbi:MAG TPA: Wadjet anti-phage system protein JetD domain-containing protein [Anaerolineales bacterium]|nr:Wadjet anti-phage system protein JetD domain-containing protein [Anaerolineales bacterium]
MVTRDLSFVPSPDVAALLHALLDAFERRTPTQASLIAEPREGGGRGRGYRAIRCNFDSLLFPAYHSQSDPVPRQITNEQLQTLEDSGVVKLDWLPGETRHLLASATLIPEHAEVVFALLKRTPQSARRARLTDLLLGERFRFNDWRLRAVQHALDQLKADQSPAPFSLTPSGDEFNHDLLTALDALDGVREETPYRVFSVRVFNDSKRFEAVMGAVVSLAKRSQAEWRGMSNDEILRELNLVANPGHLYLHGPWRLVDEAGQVMSLSEFHPSVGIPAAQVARLHRVAIDAPRVICVENPTTFYELIRQTPNVAAVCLWGNPSPACRHLLRCLPDEVTLHVWADLDYGGLNILAQLREQVNARAALYRMDIETLEAHAAWARPLTAGDVKNLARLTRRPSLADTQPLIAHMLQRGLKLEQEAVAP